MSKIGIYLAGAMSCYRDSLQYVTKAVKWRMEITNGLKAYMNSGVVVYDPTVTSEEYEHDIITQNDFYLKKMDILLVNLEDIDKSFGTMWEVATAYQYGKPIITFGSHKWQNHPYLKAMTSAHVKDVAAATEFIYTMYDS